MVNLGHSSCGGEIIKKSNEPRFGGRQASPPVDSGEKPGAHQGEVYAPAETRFGGLQHGIVSGHSGGNTKLNR